MKTAAYCTVMAPRNLSRSKSPNPAKLSEGLRRETHHVHIRADHPQSQNRGSTDRPRLDRRRHLPRDRGDTVHSAALATAISEMQAREAKGLNQLKQEIARLKKLLAEGEVEKAMLSELATGTF